MAYNASSKRHRSHRPIPTELRPRASTSTYLHYIAKVDKSETQAPRDAKKNLKKKKTNRSWISNYNAFAWWLSMNTNRERVRIGVRLYSRRGFPRQRLCKAGLARLVQPVSGSLNNACDIRAGQTKCTLARTFYLYICVCVCVYIYLYKRAYV